MLLRSILFCRFFKATSIVTIRFLQLKFHARQICKVLIKFPPIISFTLNSFRSAKHLKEENNFLMGKLQADCKIEKPS